MGEVYLAFDSRLRRQVAIKILPVELTDNKLRLSRFEREAYAASSLNHPNILTIHEIGEHDGHHFIATEYVEGESLRQRLLFGPMEFKETLAIVIQVADALAAAHEAGIVHRDIKPENVMVRRDGYVKVLDFGLAKLVTDPSDLETSPDAATKTLLGQTDPGVLIGTANYMSPEQARGLQVDARTDIWSLGTLLYEMVAGRRPFEGATTTDVLATILHREPRSLLLCRADVPGELERIVQKALTKEREERYQLARDVSVDLKRLKHRLEMGADFSQSLIAAAQSNQSIASTRNQAAASATEANMAQTASDSQFVSGKITRHMQRPLLLGALIVAGVAGIFLYYKYFGSRSRAIASIAVLPFTNASGDANTDYLSDGISESLIDKLSQLPGLKVIARSSAFKYKGKDVDPQEVANALRVDGIVTGRVVQRGDQLQVRAELIDAHDKTQLWGEQYNRTMTDVQVVQEEIARAISEKLRVRLTGVDEQQLSKRATNNPEAYQLYLNGVYYSRKSFQSLPTALDYYNRAVTLDPGFALAWTGVSDSYRTLAINGVVNPQEAIPKAKAAVKKALDLDEALAEAHVSQAVLLTSDWDWSGAERELKRAFELNPNLADAHIRYAVLLSELGRHEESIASAKRAQELDPLDLVARTREGVSLYVARRYDEAIRAFDGVLKLAPDNDAALIFRAYTYDGKGMYKEAITEYQKLVSAGDKGSGTQCYLGYALTQVGKRSEAQGILEKLKTTKDYVSPAELAILYVGLGDKENAIQSLQKAYEAHDLQLQFLKTEPHYDSLRSDPRFVDLMKKVGLPE
jgi:serine/threonine-protein kinase